MTKAGIPSGCFYHDDVVGPSLMWCNVARVLQYKLNVEKSCRQQQQVN